MIRATAVRRGVAEAEFADTITLAHDERRRRRLTLRADRGLSFLLDLPEATAIRDGEGLVLDDGRVVLVKAKPEPLLEVRGNDPRHLARLAWHIGNRHLTAEIRSDSILIEPDHVIAGMLAGLGAEIRLVTAPFDPEGGAYAGHDHSDTGADHHGHHHEHG